MDVQITCCSRHPDIRFTTPDYQTSLNQTAKLNSDNLWEISNVLYIVRVPKLGTIHRMLLTLFCPQTKGESGLDCAISFEDDTPPNYFVCDLTADISSSSLKITVSVVPYLLDYLLSIADSPYLPSITNVSVTPLLPVYTYVDHNRRCTFTDQPLTAWTSSGLALDFPFTVQARTSFLTFGYQPPDSSKVTEAICIRGTFRARGGPGSSSWDGKIIDISTTAGTSSVSVQPDLPHPHEYLPSGFDGHIFWAVYSERDAGFMFPLHTSMTPIEFYALHKQVPKYISDGIPAQVLQLLLQTHFEGVEDSYNGWVKYCMNFLRAQGFRYETLSGRKNYSDYPYDTDSNNVVTKCYLQHWLAHRDTTHGLRVRQRQRRVNCYDLASLGQVILAIGLDASIHELRMKFLEPFGMIDPTDLIGFPEMKCNSPFFEGREDSKLWSADPLWDAKYANGKYRSSFGNHAFLAIKDSSKDNIDRAIDATCGPEVGEKTLEQYIATAIDHQATNTLRYTETSGGHTSGALLSAAGSLKDIKDGPGVTDIVSPIDVQNFRLDHAKAGLIYRVETLKTIAGFPKGHLTGPVAHIDGLTLTFSWSYQAQGSSEFATIDMIIYESKANGQLNLEYVARREEFKDVEDDDPVTIRSFLDATTKGTTLVQGIVQSNSAACGSYALWHQMNQGRNDETYGLISVLVGFDDNDLKFMVNNLVNVIDADLLDPVQKGDLNIVTVDSAGNTIPDQGSMSVSRGQIFTFENKYSMQNTSNEEIQIIGADVSTKFGKVVYLEPAIDAENDIYKFSFFARETGEEEITITYFTTHMHQKSISQVIVIS